MARLTRWGCDARGRQVVPWQLIRPVKPSRRREAVMRRARQIEVPEPVEELAADRGLPVRPEPVPRGDEAVHVREPVPAVDDESFAPEFPGAASLDVARFVAAFRARRAARPVVAPPVERAASREPCGRCGVPGFRGCAHQLPFVEGVRA